MSGFQITSMVLTPCRTAVVHPQRVTAQGSPTGQLVRLFPEMGGHDEGPNNLIYHQFLPNFSCMLWSTRAPHSALRCAVRQKYGDTHI